MHGHRGQICHAGQMSMCCQVMLAYTYHVLWFMPTLSCLQQRLLTLLSSRTNVASILHNTLMELHWFPVYATTSSSNSPTPDGRGRSPIYQRHHDTSHSGSVSTSATLCPTSPTMLYQLPRSRTHCHWIRFLKLFPSS